MSVVDSEIYVAWPEWTSEAGREAVRRALMTVAPQKTITRSEVAAQGALFAEGWTSSEVVAFLASARIWLEPVEAIHPSGVRYGDAFTLALRLWNMPYRGREGRLRRFVVVGAREASDPPVVMGLIEVGDDAPYSNDRDALLSLRAKELFAWLSSQPNPNAIAAELAARLRAVRAALLPIPGVDAQTDAETILSEYDELHRRAEGRSKSAHDLHLKKRIAYLARLTLGETAFSHAASGASIPIGHKGFREGIRAIHDLTVPRIHMEMTVCGAIPPFSEFLGGKLVVAFAAHPLILRSTQDSPATILQTVFDMEKLSGLLPDYGILALTTKGLYPRHSALYNRSVVPGASAVIRLRKIGDTRGESTALLSLRTGRLAARSLAISDDEPTVSSIYGTGGSKRMRLVERAVTALGLPQALVHAGIPRPVYGAKLVSNIEEVVWAGKTPEWVVDRSGDHDVYCVAAATAWRARWLDRAMSSGGSDRNQVVGGAVTELGG